MTKLDRRDDKLYNTVTYLNENIIDDSLDALGILKFMFHPKENDKNVIEAISFVFLLVFLFIKMSQSIFGNLLLCWNVRFC